MSHIKSRDTSPEKAIRRALHRAGFRYRVAPKSYPGKPDLVLPKYHAVVFINGCFWHGHEGCGCFVMPKTNTSFWQKKIERNRERDRETQLRLAQMGWHCITVWECQLKPAVRERTLASLALTLNRIFLRDHGICHYGLPEEEDAMVAEPDGSDLYQVDERDEE